MTPGSHRTRSSATMLERTSEQKADYAHRIYCAVRAEVPEYSRRADGGDNLDADLDLDLDFADVNRRNVDLYFHILSEDRFPRADELADLEQAARRRLHQAVPLEAIFHSYHIGVRIMWECLLEQAVGLDLGRLAILTLAYSERVTHAVARAYQLEREQVSHSHQEANRLFFTRLFSADFDDEEAALHEAQSLGYDLTTTHVVVLVSPNLPRGTASAESDLDLAEVRDHLERFFPGSPAVLMRAGALIAAPGDSEPVILAAVRAALEQVRNGGASLSVGLGTPRAGVHGLIAGFEEAKRARALGAILDPSQRIYRYDELRLFDLLKAGEPVNAFVYEVLGRLVAHDQRRRSHYLETLDALFASALNRKIAARRLGIHPNTLSYRIARIEELIGGSLLSGEVCFRSQLALRLLPLSQYADHSDYTGYSSAPVVELP